MPDLEIRKEQSPAGVWDLLLLADPSEDLITDYIQDGHLFSAHWDHVLVGVFVLLDHGDDLWELKNIAVAEEWQGKGVGKVLLQQAIEAAKARGAETLEVGTGNSSLDQLAFYQKAGFRMARVAKNFFTLNYPEAIEENGIPCRDMLILTLAL